MAFVRAGERYVGHELAPAVAVRARRRRRAGEAPERRARLAGAAHTSGSQAEAGFSHCDCESRRAAATLCAALCRAVLCLVLAGTLELLLRIERISKASST
jgi:hypothetical protein